MIAELHIQTGSRDGKTYLKKAYHSTPFKVANITEDKSKPELHLMLMSSSPGILDEDEYQLKIEVEEDCSLELSTQSFQRLFNMQKGASQQLVVYMKKNSSLCYLPHPTVPHLASNFTAKNRIEIAYGCNLIWGEVLTCGRKLSGEEFQFSKYHTITTIFLNNRLVIKENLLIQPSLVDVNSMGQFEGYTHQASLIYLNENVNIHTTITEIHKCLTTYKDICFGVSALPINGVILRLLGSKGEQLHEILKQVARLLQANETMRSKVITEIKDATYAD
jgi:urease accessory protein